MNPVSIDTSPPPPIAKVPVSSLPNAVNAPQKDADPAATNVDNKDDVKNEDDKADSKDRSLLFYFRRFRYDSPPKSDESDMSDDPEKMEKLNRMKAEKELVTSKADRKLYLGNLPPNITSQQLMDMLNAALKKM